jgi:hypothetical protein
VTTDDNDDAAHVTVAIEGVDDTTVIHELEHRVREACRHARSHGQLTVAVAPADTRGRWDLGVKSPSGRHVASFAAPLARLPDLTIEHLRRILRRIEESH